MEYIATCYSHFGAMRMLKELTAKGVKAELMPVPRSLSSSCGTCVHFTDNTETDYSKYIDKHDEIEQIVEVKSNGGYRKIYGE